MSLTQSKMKSKYNVEEIKLDGPHSLMTSFFSSQAHPWMRKKSLLVE